MFIRRQSVRLDKTPLQLMDKTYRGAIGAVLVAAFWIHSAVSAVPPGYSDLDTSASEIRPLMERYSADRGNILRFYNIASSPERRSRLRKFYEETKSALAAQNFEALSQDGK